VISVKPQPAPTHFFEKVQKPGEAFLAGELKRQGLMERINEIMNF